MPQIADRPPAASPGLSHVTLIVSDLDRMQAILETVLGAECVYDSGRDTFSLSEERFFMIGDTWVATMKGAPLSERSYNHVAFRIADEDIEPCRARIEALGLEIRPPRPRVEGEGQSIYFYSPDGHLLELHSGDLSTRLSRYAKASSLQEEGNS